MPRFRAGAIRLFDVPKVRAFLALATWFYRLYGLLTHWARKTGIVMHMKSIEEVVGRHFPPQTKAEEMIRSGYFCRTYRATRLLVVSS